MRLNGEKRYWGVQIVCAVLLLVALIGRSGETNLLGAANLVAVLYLVAGFVYLSYRRLSYEVVALVMLFAFMIIFFGRLVFGGWVI